MCNTCGLSMLNLGSRSIRLHQSTRASFSLANETSLVPNQAKQTHTHTWPLAGQGQQLVYTFKVSKAHPVRSLLHPVCQSRCAVSLEAWRYLLAHARHLAHRDFASLTAFGLPHTDMLRTEGDHHSSGGPLVMKKCAFIPLPDRMSGSKLLPQKSLSLPNRRAKSGRASTT